MKISVVMPTWNRANVIQNAIRSIIDQTYKDWELIIVDDGSTDGTKRVVNDFANPKVKYFKVEHQNNISKIRNIANSHATGDILVVQDSDDLSMPDRLEEIAVTFSEYPDTDVVYHGSYLRFNDVYHNAISRTVRPAKHFDRERLKKEQYIPGQIAFTKKISQEIPYNEDIVLMDDFAFLLELAYQNKVFRPIYKNLYEYVGSADSVNVHGEMDGRRKKDTQTIIKLLKDKYGVDSHASLTLENADTGEILEKEII